MNARDTTVNGPTIRTPRTRPSTTSTNVSPTPSTRRPCRIPPRRGDRVFIAGQLSGEDYARDAMDARTCGTWL